MGVLYVHAIFRPRMIRFNLFFSSLTGSPSTGMTPPRTSSSPTLICGTIPSVCPSGSLNSLAKYLFFHFSFLISPINVYPLELQQWSAMYPAIYQWIHGHRHQLHGSRRLGCQLFRFWFARYIIFWLISSHLVSYQVWWRICKESTPIISSWALMVNPPLWAGNTSAEQYSFLQTATILVFDAISYTYTLFFWSPFAISSASQGGHAFTSSFNVQWTDLQCKVAFLHITNQLVVFFY